jgi:ABC-type multidrug transport system fused ATPase/permease subunit
LESDGTPLLKDIHLKLKPGQLVAVVGELGSGKSLLLQSLIGATGARFRAFFVDGRATAGPLDPDVRRQMAFVPQEGFTMSATLRENVLFTYLKEGGADDAVSDQLALASLRYAQFHPEKERVVDGLNAEIGERGVNLSGGQRQRVGLARAHYASRPIVLLDDCLSAVDVDTEKRLIDDLICGAWKDCARLLVTHRLAILPYCDQVIFLENGAISMQGSHRDLLRGSASYREFVQREEVKAAPEPLPAIPVEELATEPEVPTDD